MSKTIKTFCFPDARAPEKIDQEIKDWGKKNGLKEVKRSSFTAFESENKGYLICSCKFKKAKKAKKAKRACNLTEEKLKDMFD